VYSIRNVGGWCLAVRTLISSKQIKEFKDVVYDPKRDCFRFRVVYINGQTFPSSRRFLLRDVQLADDAKERLLKEFGDLKQNTT